MSPFLHSRVIVCLLFLANLGLGILPHGASAQAGTSLPALNAAVLTALPSPFVRVDGSGFSAGGLVFVALYDQWGQELGQHRWTVATTTSYGPNGSMDPAQGYAAGGTISEGFDLLFEAVYGTNGSQDPAQGYVSSAYTPAVTDAYYGLNGSQDPAAGYVSAERMQRACDSPLTARAFDQNQQAWSNTLDVSIGC